MKLKILIFVFALISLRGYSQNDPKTTLTGTTSQATIYRGAIGANTAMVLPLGTHEEIYPDLPKKGRIQFNYQTNKLEVHNGTEWLEISLDQSLLDSLKYMAERFPDKADLVVGKVPLSQINEALIGAVNYQGSYNAATNIPVLPVATVNKGKYYIINTAGTVSGIDYSVGDWIISNGLVWNKLDQSYPVDSSVISGSNNAVSGGAVYDALQAKANLASPGLTGSPTAPTAPTGTNSTQIATTAFANSAAASIVIQSITNGDTAHAVSGDVIFDLASGISGDLSVFDSKLDAVEAKIETKQDILVSGTHIRTLEGQSLLGNGNVDLAKSDIGLSNVDNTSDLNKPVSTATQTALNNKADLVGGKVPLVQIPDSLIGSVNYQGTYNPATNTPALPTAVGNKGFYYVINTAGTVTGVDYTIGDWIISDGVMWDKVTQTFPVEDTVINGNTNAVSGNAVSDVLMTKANTDGSNTSGTWPINVSGTAVVASSVKNSAGIMTYHWQDGKTAGVPATWLWGGTDATDAYVYNPADLPIPAAAQSALDAKANSVSSLDVKNQIPDAADLNNYIATGIYSQVIDAQAAKGTNYPIPYAGILEVIDAGYIYQTYQTYANINRKFFRGFYNGAWSEWKEIAAIAQTISDGVTNSAPSEDAVFDALASKANTNGANATGTWPINISGNSINSYTAENWTKTSVSDFNTPTGYRLLEANDTSIPNAPGGLYGTGIQFSTAGNPAYLSQFVFNLGGIPYTRSKIAGTWGDWSKIPFDQDVLHTTGDETKTGNLTLDVPNGSLQYKLAREGNTVATLGSGSGDRGLFGIMQLFSTAADERVRLYSGGDSWINGGNVGIGTMTPLHALDVKGVGRFGTGGVNDLTTRVIINNDLGKEWAVSSGIPQVSQSMFGILNLTDKTQPLVIDSSGNTGIGTVSPLAKLHVEGNGIFTGEVTVPDGTASTSAVNKRQLDNKVNTNGANASGSWPIDITGNAANATYWNPFIVSDFDMQTGFKLLQSNSSPSNGPVNGWSQGIQFSTNNDPLYANQLVYDITGNLYSRNKYAGAWERWNSIPFDKNVLHNVGDEIKSGSITLDGNNIGYYLGNAGNNASIIYNSDGNLDITPRAGYGTRFTAGSVISEGTIMSNTGLTVKGKRPDQWALKVDDNGTFKLTDEYQTNAPSLSITPWSYVGIGTSSPSYKLDVNGNGNISEELNFSGGQWAQRYDSNGAGGKGAFNIYRSTGYEFTIGNEGNVGIGTPNPAHKFNVSNDGREGLEVALNTNDDRRVIVQTYDRSSDKFVPLVFDASSFEFLNSEVTIVDGKEPRSAVNKSQLDNATKSKIDINEKGVPFGVAVLDSEGLLYNKALPRMCAENFTYSAASNYENLNKDYPDVPVGFKVWCRLNNTVCEKVNISNEWAVQSLVGYVSGNRK